MLAAVYRAQDDTQRERENLIVIAEKNGDSLSVLERLIEIDSGKQDWANVSQWCEKALQINPLLPSIQSAAAEAGESVGNVAMARRALEAQLALQPVDPSGVYFRLAKACLAQDDLVQAKRNVLKALEESPRYREALELLLQIRQRMDAKQALLEQQEKESNQEVQP
jgi:predicted Zn-dependent protease